MGRADILTPQQRAYCMSRIRGRDTVPEIRFRKALWGLGVRYRAKNRLSGRPDIVIKNARIVVFVDGCFWHQCPKHFVMPRTRRQFWKNKIEGNKRRDRVVNKTLRRDGWTVLRFWEHEIDEQLARACSRILQVLRRDQPLFRKERR